MDRTHLFSRLRALEYVTNTQSCCCDIIFYFKFNSNKNYDIMPFDMLEFLELYQQYPCLWDKSIADYKNRDKRNRAEQALLTFSHIKDIKTLRAKIRTMRGTYNGELRKIKSSQTTGSGASAVYKPKLIWFEYANAFLSKNHELEAESTINLILNINEEQPQEIHEDRTDEIHEDRTDEIHEDRTDEIYDDRTYEIYDDRADEIYDEQSQEIHDEQPHEIHYEQLQNTHEEEPDTPTFSQTSDIQNTQNSRNTQKAPRRKRQKNNTKDTDTLQSALNTLRELQHNQLENDFAIFGQHVGAQLQKLPLSKAIEIQQKMQIMLNEARLSTLDSANFSAQTTSQQHRHQQQQHHQQQQQQQQ